MKIKHKMSLVRYFEPALPPRQSLGNVLLQLVEEPRKVNDDSITNEGVTTLPDDSARQEVEIILLIPHNDSVATIVTSCST